MQKKSFFKNQKIFLKSETMVENNNLTTMLQNMNIDNNGFDDFEDSDEFTNFNLYQEVYSLLYDCKGLVFRGVTGLL